jgi:hypothetical protein
MFERSSGKSAFLAKKEKNLFFFKFSIYQRRNQLLLCSIHQRKNRFLGCLPSIKEKTGSFCVTSIKATEMGFNRISLVTEETDGLLM